MEEQMMQVIRVMAWERAKGELMGMLHTYYARENDFKILEEAIKTFIKDVEYNGKHE